MESETINSVTLVFLLSLPASHAADAMRATMTDLPGTHLMRSLLVMAAFAAGSLGLASAAARRRG